MSTSGEQHGNADGSGANSDAQQQAQPLTLVKESDALLRNRVEEAARAIRENVATSVALASRDRAAFLIDDDLRPIVDALASNTSLTALDLSLNEISDDGAVAIARALAQAGGNSQLQSVDLSSNAIGDAGLAELAKGMPATVTRLDVSGNRITDGGVAAFLDALGQRQQPAALRALIMRDNAALTDAALEELASRLATDDSLAALRTLQVSGNRFTDAVVPSLVAALQMNAQLTDVCLANSCITEFDGFAAVFDRNTSLLKLELGGADGKRAAVPGVIGGLKRNKLHAREMQSEVNRLKRQHADEMARVIADYEARIAAMQKQQQPQQQLEAEQGEQQQQEAIPANNTAAETSHLD